MRDSQIRTGQPYCLGKKRQMRWRVILLSAISTPTYEPA